MKVELQNKLSKLQMYNILVLFYLFDWLVRQSCTEYNWILHSQIPPFRLQSIGQKTFKKSILVIADKVHKSSRIHCKVVLYCGERINF